MHIEYFDIIHIYVQKIQNKNLRIASHIKISDFK